MDARDWIELAVFTLTAAGVLVATVRYIDGQIGNLKLDIAKRVAQVDKELSDKVSVGEYNRRHEDLERRTRAIERWQDHANGRYRHEYGQEDE